MIYRYMDTHVFDTDDGFNAIDPNILLEVAQVGQAILVSQNMNATDDVESSWLLEQTLV